VSRPDGQAPEEAFFKAAISKWSQHRETIPAPWHAAAIDLDVAFLEARLRFQRIAPDPAPALAARWGVARTTAWRRTRHMLAGDATARNDVQPPATAEPVVAPVLAVECNTDATACNQGATEPATMTPVAMFSAPVEREEEGDKNTIMPAKAGQKVAEQLWEAMEDERQRHAPGKRLAFAPRQDEVGAALRNIAATAKDIGVTPAEAIMMGWKWWWQGPNPWWRDTIKPATAPETFLRKKHTRDIVRSAAVWQAEKYIPTADEALDAVIEVGCSGAEARYPAAARAIRQTFDFEMSGDLARMRNHPDPAKVRARWSAGYAKYLTPKPTLALVAR
jgi:hypothetical protein